VRDVLAVMGIEDDAACLGTSVRLDTDAIMDTLASFRADVRTIARSESTGATTKKELLTACDRVRDKTLNELGVRLEDKAGGESTWKRG
jgi:cysteinyl-tRNA synthetase